MAALAIPGLPFFMLTLAFLAALPFLQPRHRSPLRLLWRARWLLLVLVLGYAYGLPGAPLMPGLGDFSPSVAGLLHGGRQALGLAALILWLDILVLGQPTERLLGGLYQLARPLVFVGLDAPRFALRLGLTLKAIEDMERGRGNLSRLLDQEHLSSLPVHVQVWTHPLHILDLLVPPLLFVALISLWFSA